MWKKSISILKKQNQSTKLSFKSVTIEPFDSEVPKLVEGTLLKILSRSNDHSNYGKYSDHVIPGQVMMSKLQQNNLDGNIMTEN